MERIIRNCDICGKNISDTTNEFINERKDYFSDKNNFNIKEG